MLQRLDCRFIIWLEEIIDDPSNSDSNLFIVTEYHKGGSLKEKVEALNRKSRQAYRNAIEKKEPAELVTRGLNPKVALPFFRDILQALYYCHKIVKVIHRDIKPENIVINCNYEAVLIDFGVSASVEQQQGGALRSP